MARQSKLTQDLINGACSALVARGQRVTVANVRSFLMENAGFAGNNNDLCPMVAEWKSAAKDAAKGEDNDAMLAAAIALNANAAVDLPADVKHQADQLIAIMYQAIYDRIDSEIGSDRTQQMELEIDKLQAQLEDYYRMRAEYQGMQASQQQLITQLVEANRLVDMQKVAVGERLVLEMEQATQRYEEMLQELTEAKTQAEYSKARNAELQQLLSSLTADNERLRERETQLEEAVLRLSTQDDELGNDREALLEATQLRNAELIREIEELKANQNQSGIPSHLTGILKYKHMARMFEYVKHFAESLDPDYLASKKAASKAMAALVHNVQADYAPMDVEKLKICAMFNGRTVQLLRVSLESTYCCYTDVEEVESTLIPTSELQLIS